VSQNGLLGSEPARPAFIAHVPEGVDTDVKRTMLKKLNTAVAKAYQLPWFITFLHEHSLELVAVDGVVLADDQQRVEAQRNAYR
jgi:phage baseplate assembly protein W